ncbi:MAG TPA: hypothetical protein VGD67_12195 [Pseudonocardiaceae bacterium]
MPGAPAPGAPAGLPARGPFPALGNGRVRLRALTPHDLDWLRAAETDEFLAFRWRLRGAHPNPADYLDQLWNGALALFVVERADGPIGIVSAYQADHRNGHCRVAAARLSADEAGDGSFLAGLALFLEYLFTGWPLRKVYLETPEFTLPQFASAVDRGILRVEARLEEFMFLADRYWDVLFLSASRSSWTEFLGTPLARRLLGRPDTAGPADLVTAAPAFTLPVRRP